ncbi:MAG: cysteine--tRNA ligase [bacterium]
MPIHFHNSLKRKLQTFKSIKPGQVGLYTCGPTVYNHAHIGNLRTYIFEDILKRVLLFNGLKVKHVMNITDVGHLTSDADHGQDKMEKGAQREGKTAWEIAEFYTQAFKQDLQDLNIIAPNRWCKATNYIKEQIKLVKILEKKGFTYITSDGVYFNTSKFKNYGELANLKAQKAPARARVSLGEKKNPTDFALWKFSGANEKRQMEWKSPWGIGFPGWHLECSAMSAKYLGQPFDIHCGGIDHIPIHHTNEIAQSECANDKPLANYWLHGEFLLIQDHKMAKSDDNFLTLQSIKDKNASVLAYRYFLLQTHYRKQLNFSWQALQSAQNGLEHLYNLATELPTVKIAGDQNLKNKFTRYINNDLYLPGALAMIWDALKSKKISLPALLEFDQVLGLRIKENIKKSQATIPASVQKLVKERELARQNQDWNKSDKLRNQIKKLGYTIIDTADGMKITSD